MMTKVNAIKCPKCQCSIFSRARHDFRSCLCKTVSIDGGFDYVRLVYSFPPETPPPKVFELEIEQTPTELYNDWNLSVDNFGIIEEE